MPALETKDFLDDLPDGDVTELLHAAEIAHGGESILDVVPRVSPEWTRPEHLSQVADALARSLVEPVRICLDVPPRHGKTETILHGAAWSLDVQPRGNNIAYVTYEAGLAWEKSKQIQDYAQKLGVKMRSRQAADIWQTDAGSKIYATGIGGPLTGRGMRLLIIDDPYKGRAEAESPVIRNKVWDWFRAVAVTRREPNTSIVVVHTRWHKDDLIGRISSGDTAQNWELIHIPAINEEGEALWPELRPLSFLEEQRAELGEYEFSALFMGAPRPRGSQLFCDEHASYRPFDLDGWTILVSVDPAATEKNSADHSVILVAALRGKPASTTAELRVLDVQRGQWGIPELVRRTLAVCEDWGAPAVVEAVGGFKAVPQMMRDIDRRLKIYSATPSVDKFIRAQPVAAAWGRKKVSLPTKPAPWKKPFLGEVTSFTGVKDAKDDQVDALSLAWNAYAATRRLERGYRVAGWRAV